MLSLRSSAASTSSAKSFPTASASALVVASNISETLLKLKPVAPEAVVLAVDLGTRSAPPRRIVVSDSLLAVEAMMDAEGVI